MLGRGAEARDRARVRRDLRLDEGDVHQSAGRISCVAAAGLEHEASVALGDRRRELVVRRPQEARRGSGRPSRACRARCAAPTVSVAGVERLLAVVVQADREAARRASPPTLGHDPRRVVDRRRTRARRPSRSASGRRRVCVRQRLKSLAMRALLIGSSSEYQRPSRRKLICPDETAQKPACAMALSRRACGEERDACPRVDPRDLARAAGPFRYGPPLCIR